MIKVIDERIEQLIYRRDNLYKGLDKTHYSPSNLDIYPLIIDVTTRLNELYNLKTTLLENNNKNEL